MTLKIFGTPLYFGTIPDSVSSELIPNWRLLALQWQICEAVTKRMVFEHRSGAYVVVREHRSKEKRTLQTGIAKNATLALGLPAHPGHDPVWHKSISTQSKLPSLDRIDVKENADERWQPDPGQPETGQPDTGNWTDRP